MNNPKSPKKRRTKKTRPNQVPGAAREVPLVTPAVRHLLVRDRDQQRKEEKVSGRNLDRRLLATDRGLDAADRDEIKVCRQPKDEYWQWYSLMKCEQWGEAMSVITAAKIN